MITTKTGLRVGIFKAWYGFDRCIMCSYPESFVIRCYIKRKGYKVKQSLFGKVMVKGIKGRSE